MVTVSDVQAAADRIRPFVVRTPVERSLALSAMCGVDVWLKLECFQATGSFKLRGGLNALLSLDDGERRKGVVTASAGNHGLGVARAAAVVGVPALVVVPETASLVKIDALRDSGAELLLRGADYDAAESAAISLADERGLPFISAYNDPDVIAGGGTVALEVFEDLPALRKLVVPAGGGGLIGGVGVAAHGLYPETAIYGAQSVASPALHAALEAGALVPVEVQPSLADGLSGNVEPGSITFDLLAEHVRDVLLVEESDIALAMRWLVRNERVLVEGSAAVGVAALLRQLVPIDGPLVVILTGRNVAASVLQQYVFA